MEEVVWAERAVLESYGSHQRWLELTDGREVRWRRGWRRALVRE